MNREYWDSHRKPQNDTEHEREYVQLKGSGPVSDAMKLQTDLLMEKVQNDVLNDVQKNADLSANTTIDDDDDEFFKIRQNRLAELKKNLSQQKNQKYSSIREINESDFSSLQSNHDSRESHDKYPFLGICFFSKDFDNSKIFKHLITNFCRDYSPEIEFCSIEAENAPFFVSRLGIKTLPQVLFFEGDTRNLIDYRQYGFNEILKEEDLGNLSSHSGDVISSLNKGIVEEGEAFSIEDFYRDKFISGFVKVLADYQLVSDGEMARLEGISG